MKKLWILLVLIAVVIAVVIFLSRDQGRVAPELPVGETPLAEVSPDPGPRKADETPADEGLPEFPAATLRFTVQDEDGAPIAGAEVDLFQVDVVDLIVTDADGMATFDVWSGTWWADAVAKGYARAGQRELALEEGEVLDVTFTLERGVPFRGVVVDASTGEPVAGASIVVEAGGSVDGYSELRSRGPYDQVLTDEDGKFMVRGIPFLAVGTLVVRDPEYRLARIGVRAPEEGAPAPEELTIELEPGATIYGIVYDPDGEPLSGATVFVVPAYHEMLRENPHVTSTGSGGLVRAITATTGEDGSFRIDGLTFGGVMVAMAEGEGFARSEDSDELLPSAENRSIRLVLTLRYPATFELTLKDENGEPATEVRCRIGGFLSGFNKNRADAPGFFRFVGLRPGRHIATIGSMRFVDTEVPLDLAAGETTKLTVTLDPGAIVSGVLVDGAGKPVAGARVDTDFLADPVNTCSNSTAETDEMGHFVLRGLKPGAVRLKARTEGFLTVKPLTVDAPIEQVRLVGAWLGTASLTVKTPDGSLLPEIVFLWRWKAGHGSPSSAAVRDGVLRFTGFTGEPEILDLRIEGFVPLKKEVVVRPGEDIDLGVVTLDPGVNIRGVVKDPDGEPVADAELSWDGPSTAVSAADGRFELRNVPAGELALTVDAEGFVLFEEKKETQAGEVEVRMSRGARVTVTVKGENGRPVTGAWLRFLRVVGEKLEYEDAESLDETGTVHLHVPVGRYRIETDRDDEEIKLAEETFTEGEIRTLNLTLPD